MFIYVHYNISLEYFNSGVTTVTVTLKPIFGRWWILLIWRRFIEHLADPQYKAVCIEAYLCNIWYTSRVKVYLLLCLWLKSQKEHKTELWLSRISFCKCHMCICWISLDKRFIMETRQTFCNFLDKICVVQVLIDPLSLWMLICINYFTVLTHSRRVSVFSFTFCLLSDIKQQIPII